MIVKSFKSFIDKGKITYMCHKLGIKKFKVRQDGKVDVGGNVCIHGKKLKQIPIKFGNVSGHFECQNNYLRNLENCPDFVGGDFECSGNYIETLEFLPKRINGGFFCKNNRLKSIDNLEKCNVGGDIYLRNNFLNSLKGSPRRVFGHFDVSGNHIESLEHCPESISGDLMIYDNLISNLSGFPKFVGGSIDLSVNEIRDFRGIPEETNFDCVVLLTDNPVWEIVQLFEEEMVDKEFNLEIILSINEWGAIYENKLIWDRLVEVFYELNIIPQDLEHWMLWSINSPDPNIFDNYKIIF